MRNETLSFLVLTSALAAPVAFAQEPPFPAEAGANRFGRTDFALRQFRSNLVLRWEYKPGSALYVVWQQGRNGAEPAWVDSFHQNWNALWSTPADNVFLVKLSYWFSP